MRFHQLNEDEMSPIELIRHIEKELAMLKAKLPKTPCDLCISNPPSSMDGKSCSFCCAEAIPDVITIGKESLDKE